MRWKRSPKVDGQKRIISKFLFLPLTIDDETRWLERATIYQEYEECRIISAYLVPSKWENVRWVNDTK